MVTGFRDVADQLRRTLQIVVANGWVVRTPRQIQHGIVRAELDRVLGLHLTHPIVLEEADDLALSPAPVVAVCVCQKCAMPAVSRFQQGYGLIVLHFLSGLRKQTNEWIVVSMDHQGRYSDLFDNTGGGSTVIIILCALETAVSRRNNVVEFTNGRWPSINFFVDLGQQFSFTAVPAPHRRRKIPFLNALCGPLHRSSPSAP